MKPDRQPTNMILDHLGLVIRAEREMQGLSMLEVYRRGGISPSQASRLEHDRPFDRLEKMVEKQAKALGVAPLEIWKRAIESWESREQGHK